MAKANADLITISGHDGGTGASPLTSIRYAGSPWELGLSETQQTLVRNGLRQRVIVQTDGGLKTGLDVIKAAMLGAQSFGFGTAPMVALGCKYLRICHLNSCATGVATQNEELRKKHYDGPPEQVENFFRFVADDVRQHMARLGVRRLDEIIGRTHLLKQRVGATVKQNKLNLAPLLDNGLSGEAPGCAAAPIPQSDLAKRIAADTKAAVENASGGEFQYAVINTDRSIGARLSGDVARRHGDQGMAANPITLRLTGAAGQSLGAWNAGGVHIVLDGEANDGVGKGMAGGRIVVLDEARDFVDRYNHELVDITRISHEGMENYWQHLRTLLLRYVEATESAWGHRIVEEFRELVHKFWLVKPKAASLDSLADELRRAA